MNVNVLHCTNINVFDYRGLPQTLQGVSGNRKCLYHITFLKSEELSYKTQLDAKIKNFYVNARNKNSMRHSLLHVIDPDIFLLCFILTKYPGRDHHRLLDLTRHSPQFEDAEQQ